MAKPRLHMIRRLLLFLLLLPLFAGCAPAATATPTPTPTPAPTPQQPVTPEPASLTLWLPDWMALEDRPGYQALNESLLDYQTQTGVQITVIPKLPRGPEGLLSSLQKTQPVAPSLLPDIIALPFQDIPIAGANDLLQPLGDIYPTDVQEDLFPFAQAAGLVDDVWMALPFAADFEHLAFQPAALSEPPNSWNVILSSSARYAFPYGGSESSWTDAVLLHYLSAVPAGQDPARNAEALRRLLTFYEAAYQQGLIDENGGLTSNPADTWKRALQGNTPMAETTASLWLTRQDQATVLRFGPTPTQDGRGRYLMHGWAYAIITADERRQALAGALLQQLMASDTLADWTYQAHLLPTRRSSLIQWSNDDFLRFASEALEQGFLMPDFVQDKEMARRVHQAVRQVLSGQQRAEAAWNQAVTGW